MCRYLLTLPLLLLFVLAACGNDDGDNANPSAPNGDGEATTVNGNGNGDDNGDGDTAAGPNRTPRPLSTPTPVQDEGVVFVVAAGGQLYEPTRQEFNALPQETITVNGADYTGVSLTTLAQQAGAGDATFVTIEGLSPDGQRPGVARFPLEDVGDNSVLIIDDSGHVRLVGVEIPEAQWLTAVGAIDFS